MHIYIWLSIHNQTIENDLRKRFEQNIYFKQIFGGIYRLYGHFVIHIRIFFYFAEFVFT